MHAHTYASKNLWEVTVVFMESQTDQSEQLNPLSQLNHFPLSAQKMNTDVFNDHFLFLISP